jgi:hypothetical protein
MFLEQWQNGRKNRLNKLFVRVVLQVANLDRPVTGYEGGYGRSREIGEQRKAADIGGGKHSLEKK